eukprot:1169999-Amphidinium_carterae.3
MLQVLEYIGWRQPRMGVLENVPGMLAKAPDADKAPINFVMDKLVAFGYHCDFVRVDLSTWHAASRDRLVA